MQHWMNVMQPGLIELVSGGNLIALILILWRLSRAAGAMERIVRDFPPHRHIGEDIIYPTGYDPGKPSRIHMD